MVHFQGRNAARISSLATLFIIFINDLLRQFDESAMVTAYADGLAKACRWASKKLMTANLRAEVDKVDR